MTEVADTWNAVDLPVLREAVRLCDEDLDGGGARLGEIAQAAGISEDDTFRALRRLASDGLLDVAWMNPARAARVRGADRDQVGRVSSELLDRLHCLEKPDYFIGETEDVLRQWRPVDPAVPLAVERQHPEGDHQRKHLASRGGRGQSDLRGDLAESRPARSWVGQERRIVEPPFAPRVLEAPLPQLVRTHPVRAAVPSDHVRDVVHVARKQQPGRQLRICKYLQEHGRLDITMVIGVSSEGAAAINLSTLTQGRWAPSVKYRLDLLRKSSGMNAAIASRSRALRA